MSTSSNEQKIAEQQYESGLDLYQKGMYNDALIELRRAENIFRTIDARGHAFTRRLANDVSGLANTLALEGSCYQKLGIFKMALSCYETSLINAKFENKKALREFEKTFSEDLTFCYEKALEESNGKSRERFLGGEPVIDISFRFPYSLPQDIVPIARLYELEPERYPQYRDYYQRAKEHDADIRRQSKTSDESAMIKMSVYVWSIIIVIWVIYGFIVVKNI
jgi:tetratricopeptide (TPR) repeat protein